MNISFIAKPGSDSVGANPPTSCVAPAKWAFIVNDQLFPAPRRELTARVILEQSGHASDMILVRDHGGTDDVPLANHELIDLAQGNVFKAQSRCEAPQRSSCHTPAKLAYVVDDAWKVSIIATQTVESLKGLFGLPLSVDLLRDHEAPNDEPLPSGHPVRFADGPVFTLKRAGNHCCREMKIIVNGRERTVDGSTITYESLVQLAFGNASSDTIYTITFKKGPPANPQGSLAAGGMVKLECGMIFNVTATTKS